MSPEDFSEGSYFAIRALQHLGEHARARELTNTWQAWLDEWAAKSALTPYFATSLPELLLFSVDPEAVKKLRIRTMQGAIAALRGEHHQAVEHLTEILADRPDDPIAFDLLLHITRRRS